MSQSLMSAIIYVLKVAVGLKEIDKTYMLHLIDHAIIYSAATEVKSRY